MVIYLAVQLKTWLKAIRLPFFTATLIPVALGSIVAWHDTNYFIWGRFWPTILAALLIHGGVNLANDYFDHVSGCDGLNLNPTPFSGGSRMIQKGLIKPKAILYASLALFILGSSIGLYLNYLCGKNVVLILGFMGVFLGFFYSVKPFRIGYGSIGELAAGVGFGPLMVAGSYYVQTQNLPFSIILISIPVGILIALVLLINEFPDYLSDKASGKKTQVVALGKKKAMLLYHSLLVIVYLVIVFLVICRLLPVICLIAFLSAPLAIKSIQVSRKNFDKVYELLPANAATIGLHFIIGLLLCIGLALDKIMIQNVYCKVG